MTNEEIVSKWPELSFMFGPEAANRDYSFWGMGGAAGTKFVYPNIYKAIENVYGSYDKAPQGLLGLMQDKVGYGASVADYEKQLNSYKANEAQYYKDAIAKDASVSGWNSAQVAFAGGTPQGLENPQLAQEAIAKGYISPTEAKSIIEPAYSSNYSAGIGQYNNDLTGGGGLLNQVLGSITSNPISTLAFPIVGAAALGAFSIGSAAEAAALSEGATAAEAAAAGANAAAAAEAASATDYLGSAALGGSETGAVGSGATGFGMGTGVAGTGINTGALGGMEWLGGAGTLAEGTAGLTAEQIAQAQLSGQIGSNAASGLGYLGGAESLPAGTAGLTGVTAPSTLSLSDAQRALKLGQSLLGGQQQQAGQPQQQQQQIKPRGMVDYSPTLNLLALQKASTPNVYSLLG